MQYQRRDNNTWLKLFEHQEQSGLSAVEFCRQQQINIQTFYTRRRDIRRQQTSSKFVQVKREMTTIESRMDEGTQAFILEHGCSQLSVPVNVSSRWLASLMKALNE